MLLKKYQKEIVLEKFAYEQNHLKYLATLSNKDIYLNKMMKYA